MLTVDRMALITFSVVRACAILLAAIVATRVADRSVRALRLRLVTVMKRRTPGTAATELEKRGATFGGILRRTQMDGTTRDELKAVVREVLAEGR